MAGVDLSDPDAALDALMQSSAELYERYAVGNLIVFVHTVTIPGSLRRLWPRVDAAARKALVAYAWQAVAAFYSGYAIDCDPIGTPELATVTVQGLTEQAEKYFREALEKNPRIPLALLQMASITYDSGRHLPARGYIQRFAEIARHNPRSLWLGILIERELGDRDAEASYALSLEKNFPDSKEAGMLSN